MTKIPLTSGFQLIPEGTYIFRIDEVIHDEDFNKITVKMSTQDGLRHIERYSLMNKDGELVEGAINAFSYFAKTAMNNFSLEDIEPKELEGHYIQAEVVHNQQPSRNNPAKMTTFANLADKAPAEGFASASQKESKPAGYDLQALLGG